MEKVMPLDYLDVWTIYDHPSDYPNDFVARKTTIHKAVITVARDVLKASSLEAIRALVQAHSPNVLDRFERNPDDDPVIVECWM
jgi:hypothetical protein